ncbi:hypothetical protein HF086_001411 [Spodoptera exigua]|uniref:Uncharacterized protein n=1 Tax=Spodoptera exigua TaxID=7107 RepID=A0A922MD15_SPOEX|nr:hypothetical protein HF086_001411 [Spodoptera exigua]
MLTGTYRHYTTPPYSLIVSSPMNLVEFGTGLFLSKTPSEEAPQDVFSASGRSSLGGFGRSHTKSTSSAGSAPPPRLDYRSMVSVDDMPDLFASFDNNVCYRVDDLFKFLTHWVPDRYGPLGDVSAQGYELIDSDTEWDDDEAKPGHKDERTGSTGDVSDLTRESWELLKAPYVKIYSIMKSQAEALGDSLGEEPRQEVPPRHIG